MYNLTAEYETDSLDEVAKAMPLWDVPK